MSPESKDMVGFFSMLFLICPSNNMVLIYLQMEAELFQSDKNTSFPGFFSASFSFLFFWGGVVGVGGGTEIN